jgi:hypothetical protein
MENAYLPEILDNFVLLLITTVIGMLLPVINIDIRNATDEKFEFSLIEDVDQICGDEFIESGYEGVELFFHTLLDLPFRDEPENDKRR